MSQYVSNPNATSSLSGWTKSAGSLTATADGAHWISSSGTSSRRVTVSTTLDGSDSGEGNSIYESSGWSVRRNTAASGNLSKIDFYSTAYGHTEMPLTDVDFPVGQFVTLPNLRNYLPEIPPGLYPDDYAIIQALFYGPSSGPLDYTIKGVRVYDDADNPANVVLDAGDCDFNWTQADNSLSVTFGRAPSNESVNEVKWTWGHGATTTSGPAAGSGQKNSGVVHTFPNAGLYTVALECKSPTYTWLGGSGTRTTFSDDQIVMVPTGPFLAKFSHIVDYPSIAVDGRSSIAPTNSPVTTYAWNWGDGTTSVGATASHSYAAAGTYNVTLTISQSAVLRTNQITKTIVIAAAPTPVTAPGFTLGLFFDDPTRSVNPAATGLQAEVKPLLLADDIKWNWTRNEVPTMTFSAPSDWLTTTLGATLDTLKSDLIIRLNFGSGWVEPPSGRMVVADENTDPLNPQDRVQVTCVGIAGSDLDGVYFTPGITGTAYTRDEVKANYSRLFTSATPGNVLRTLLPVATIPGGGAPFLNFLQVDFSDTVDSKGAAWLQTISNLAVPADSSGLDLMQALIENGALDWYCQGNLVRVFNPRTSGKRGPLDGIPELVPGRDIYAAPQKRTLRNMTYGAIVVPNEGLPMLAVDFDTTSDSYREVFYRGRRYVALQTEGAKSAPQALIVAKPTLAALKRAKNGEMTRELRFYNDMPYMPYRDYHVGDVVYAPGPDGKLITVTVEGITVSQDSSNGASAVLTLGNAFTVNSLASKVASLSGGKGISVGAVGERPPSATQGYIGTLVSAKVTNDNGAYDAGSQLLLEGKNSGGTAQLLLGADSSPRVWSPAIYARTYSSTANVTITSAGTLGRSTSARKYKDDIQPADPFDDRILDLEPRTWFDKIELTNLGEDAHRYTGLIAEEVEDLGLGQFVSYGADGQVEGLAYERLWIPLIPLVKRQRDQIADLEARLARLEAVLTS